MIKEDNSYITDLQNSLLDKGLATKIVSYINITGDNKEIKNLCDKLSDKFLMYQYKKNSKGNYICSYKDQWKIFYWSNGNNLVKLSFNEKSNNRVDDIKEVVSFIKDNLSNNIDICLQCGVALLDDKIISTALSVYNNSNGKFITLGGEKGKLKEIAKYKDSYYGYTCNYGFFKKGARNRYYQITNAEVCLIK